MEAVLRKVDGEQEKDLPQHPSLPRSSQGGETDSALRQCIALGDIGTCMASAEMSAYVSYVHVYVRRKEKFVD